MDGEDAAADGSECKGGGELHMIEELREQSENADQIPPSPTILYALRFYLN